MASHFMASALDRSVFWMRQHVFKASDCVSVAAVIVQAIFGDISLSLLDSMRARAVILLQHACTVLAVVKAFIDTSLTEHGDLPCTILCGYLRPEFLPICCSGASLSVHVPQSCPNVTQATVNAFKYQGVIMCATMIDMCHLSAGIGCTSASELFEQASAPGLSEERYTAGCFIGSVLWGTYLQAASWCRAENSKARKATS